MGLCELSSSGIVAVRVVYVGNNRVRLATNESGPPCLFILFMSFLGVIPSAF